MQFTINAQILLTNIIPLGRILNNKSPHPLISNGILIKVLDDELVFTSSNSDLYLNLKLKDHSLSVTEKGTNILPGKLFIDSISKLNSDDLVNFSIFDNVLTIKTSKTNFKINCLANEDDDYPESIFDFTDLKPIILKSDDLKTIINSTSCSVTSTDSRIVLQGVCFRLNQNILKAVSTDSYRLSQDYIELNDSFEESEFIIPSRNITEISRMLPAYNVDVTIYQINKSIVILIEDFLISSRTIEGNFPKTDSLIPNGDFQLEVKFNREELLNAANISLIFSSEKANAKNIGVFSVIDNGLIELKSYDTASGQGKTVITPLNDISGIDFSMALNSRHLVDALNSFYDNFVTIHFVSPVKQFIMTSEKEKTQIQLMLPVRAD